MPIGSTVDLTAAPDALARSRQRAALMPDLLVEARRVVSTVIAGWHGRRRRGVGENFWQFRPFVEGEPVSRIDWRRSARDDHVYLRDREWEAAQTVWLWADPSPSMRFMSSAAQVSKESRALVIVLALAEILSRSGERIGYPGVVDPISARNAAERIAGALLSRRPDDPFPPDDRLKRFTELVIVSDLLDPVDEVVARIDQLGRRGIRGHIVMISDPAEEMFPYAGRTEFRDPETGATLTAGRAETLREEYATVYRARREHIAEHCRRLGWSFIPHRTDHLASEALVAVHGRLSGAPQAVAPRAAGASA
ncbi:DUF58 domain-containing protein [Aurantimonas coralicida]|uniref:DUF58 domain-containing protein n=2 Tax=Aurantimonas coralicida TaxID=182270 RepID=UPI001D1843F8|nr:DUF58 domain-containing protein [Aurantimonas coralicida]MCC4297573.1 DUF58 domain-containing protein [Aurantimonas coralicida]MCD1641397.1 DUF58 domain-containing protein [Aurantimonas coralicida]MCW7542338.1 DUF58 domain-containing protein [Aurantimonas litoralis]